MASNCNLLHIVSPQIINYSHRHLDQTLYAFFLIMYTHVRLSHKAKKGPVSGHMSASKSVRRRFYFLYFFLYFFLGGNLFFAN